MSFNMDVSHFKRWVSSVKEKFFASKEYIKESKNDPPEQPYKSKYKAQEILSNLLIELESLFGIKSNEMHITLVWAILKYELGVISLETEEYSTGCENLTECWEVLKEFSLKSECCLLALNVLNQLGILWSGRGEPSKALCFLTEAENIYRSYRDTCECCPFLPDDIFKDERNNEDWKPFEETFTLTLYYLAQVYEHLKDSERSAKYCHMTLKRQKESSVYDEKEWSINCATLSQYYIQEKLFATARHLLACSSSTITKYELSLDNKVDNEDVWDDVRRAKAEVAWCWLKYCINLLSECQNVPISENSERLDPTFKLSDEADVLEIENKVACCIASFEEARQVFLYAQNQIKEVKLYYTLSDYANNYVQVIQDHSRLYKHLIFYESDLTRQCKMHKRRIDLLEKVLSKLNPQYYLAVCRQLRFELGETYYELIDLKLKIIGSSDQGMALTVVKKINSLITHAINHFKAFVESLKDQGGLMPEEFEDDLVRPALIAHFYLGGLYLKLIESDCSKKLQNLSKSESYYKFILSYIEKNPSQEDFVAKELPVIKEMIQLMPERVIQVAGSTIF